MPATSCPPNFARGRMSPFRSGRREELPAPWARQDDEEGGVEAVSAQDIRPGGTMKTLKKDSRLRIPTTKLFEVSDNWKEKKKAKLPEQPTPPIQEEPEPVSNVLQGDDILALAIKKEDLKKQHLPHLKTEAKPAQKFIVRKFKPKTLKREVRHLVAHSAPPDAATKPLDFGPGHSFKDSHQILPHHILGNLQDFKRIALARGNTKLAEQIPTPPCLLTLISAKDEPKFPKTPKAEKEHLWTPSLQHNFLKNWQRHIALRKQQQEALSKHLKKPVGDLVMHAGEAYRRIQEEQECIDRALPTQHDGKCGDENSGFWSRLEYVGDEITGLVMTKTKRQRGLMEPITHVRKPRSIRAELGLPDQKDAWYRSTWDRSLFLIYRRKELQNVLAELDFNQQDIDGLEVVGRGKPFSAVTVEDYKLFENIEETSSEDTVSLDLMTSSSDVSMPILGPSLLFCGKRAFWIRGSNPQDKGQVGIAACMVFETVEGEKTSSELTVVNNGTVAIWYDWRRQAQLQSFQDLTRNRTQRFYFNNRAGVILPGETKNFTFSFKSLDAGIFRESWEFRTHPTVLGGALLQVNLHAISLAQDISRQDRMSLQNKLTSREALTTVDSLVQELQKGILTPERSFSPVDAYVTEEDLFHYRNPLLHYQHPVVQNLHKMWHQYIMVPPKAPDARLAEEEQLSSRTRHPQAQSASVLGGHPSRSEGGAQKHGSKFPPWKTTKEEIPQMESTGSPLESESQPVPEWNLCLDDFKKAVMALPDENYQEEALIRLNRGALELCQEPTRQQSDFLYQNCLQLWWNVIDSLVSYSLWLRALLGLPEKETIYLDGPDEQDHKLPPVMEVKVTAGRVGKEDRKGPYQEKKQLGIKDKEDKKGAKLPKEQDRINSKKQKAKDDKKLMKSTSRDRVFMDDMTPDSLSPSQEPIDPLVMEAYIQSLHSEVYELLDTLVTRVMILADDLSPMKRSVSIFETDLPSGSWQTDKSIKNF
ncbi:PREDICTED: MYCBP-associated protein [Elephantulus edwardii]|uniref:MYCBP-associated protein n=1 Tax=Elephantulus edwardii TaxID=28737 RepID=UPI0003F05F1B|nr:PREDICTED: MYCBP-associated protein [Elephantulus edwardii]